MDKNNPLIRSSVRTLTPYTPGEQPKLPNLIKLNTNENAYPPTPTIRSVLASLNPDDLRLYPEPDCDTLRDHISRALHVPTQNLFIANGSDEALRLVIDAFCEPSGSVGYVDPSYSLYPVLADIRGVQLRPLDLWPSNPNTTHLAPLSAPPNYSASVFFLTNPNAPTGVLFDHESVHAFASNFPGIVVIDEAYADFAGASCIDLALSLPNVLVCRTLSKAYSLAGLRLGFLIGSSELMEALYAIKDSYNIDRIAQAVACTALDDQPWMLSNVHTICATRDRLAHALQERGWLVYDSATNFLWASPPPPLQASNLYAHLRAQGIIVRYWSTGRLARFLRITIGTDPQIDRFLAALPPSSK